ncbi:hypothetical protein GCM10007937_00170 [Mesorhizobium albiziae]|uniref:hypothetical protein n=1 Tax=Neomesorhizobium albiziae TaxID=335020 RepID=UPI00235BBF4B|nr:hypothetical protein [Mesorhizobium albiziae]GLS28310.1 hypothetical protein GCM10007937_00170 [Mesorhizobium albiziae]
MDKNGEGAAPDPALLLSQAWVEAHVRTLALCLKQQQLETQLAISVGFPAADVALPDGSQRKASSLEDLEEALGRATSVEIARAEEAEALASHWARWRAKDAELGYSAAKEAEQQAADKEQLLLDKLAITPARTIAGVIAKLAVVLREGEDNRDPSDFPLPHIRSVLEDLARVTGHSTPGESKPLSAARAPIGQQGAS